MCGLPVVSIGTHYPGLSIDTVMEDNDAVSRLAMQHLAPQAAAAFALSDSRITARHFPSGIFRICSGQSAAG